MTRRNGSATRVDVPRGAAVLAVVVVVLAPAEPALAAARGWQGSGLTAWQMIGVFVGIPIGLFVVIVVLFELLPAWWRNARQRPRSPGSAEQPGHTPE